MTGDVRSAEGELQYRFGDPDAWRDVDECEGCGTEKGVGAMRAIQMYKGRRQLLCRACFMKAVGESMVSSVDERIQGGLGS